MPRLDWWIEDEPGDCPEPETVAAFIDGTLGADARASVARHVSGCARCYEAFTGTVDFQQADDVAGRSRPSVAWLAVAAALIGVVLGGLVLRSWRTELPDPESYLASVAGLHATADAPPWPVVAFRGPGSEALPATAFEVGVLLVDAHALASRGDAAAAQPRFARLAALLDEAGFLGREADLCREASRAAPETIGPYAARLPALARDLGDRFDRRDLVLGSWAAAGRRAALAHHAPYFEDAHQRAILDFARSRGALGADADAAIKDLADRWPKGTEAQDWPGLADAFDALLQARVR